MSLFARPNGSPGNLPWFGLRQLKLSNQRLSAGSSAYAAASGIVFVSGHDTLLVTLADGSVHAIASLSQLPVICNAPGREMLCSSTLSSRVRSVFLRHHAQQMPREPISIQTACRLTGCAEIATGGVVVSALECVPNRAPPSSLTFTRPYRPNFFDYVSDSDKRTTFSVCPLWHVSAETIVESAACLVKSVLFEPLKGELWSISRTKSPQN